MASIKLTPLFLFLIMIVVLVISYIFGYKTEEGFVSYNQNQGSMYTVMIPFYSCNNTTAKLYDNLYFDPINANLIELDSSAFTGNIDVNGASIRTVTVTPREGKTSEIYTAQITGNILVSQNTQLSLRHPVISSYSSWVYNTTSTNTDKYSVVYIPFDDSTYIHVINTTPTLPVQIGTYLFSSGNTGSFNKTWGSDATSLTGLTTSGQDNDINNNKFISDPMYSVKNDLYQIGKYVKYDVSNGNLIIQSGDNAAKTLTVYDRNGKTGAAVGGLLQNISTFSPYTVIDAFGQNLVVYMAIAQKTVVALLKYDPSNKRFTLGNVARFDRQNVISGQKMAFNNKQDSVNRQGATSDSAVSDYYKWYWYWNTAGSSKNSNGVSNDYMLKTQIVPPVCPACPACNSNNNSTCTNCGGQGGSGTLARGGNSMVADVNAGGAVSNVSRDIASTAKTGIVTAGALVAGAGIEAGALAEDAASGTANFAKDAASGTANFAKDAASGTANFVKDAASGITGLLKNGEGQGQGQGQDQRQGKGNRDLNVPMVLGTQNQYTDQYSYYGTLPAKKSTNYMPVTADFSKFGK
jgi:hypothetical protein